MGWKCIIYLGPSRTGTVCIFSGEDEAFYKHVEDTTFLSQCQVCFYIALVSHSDPDESLHGCHFEIGGAMLKPLAKTIVKFDSARKS